MTGVELYCKDLAGTATTPIRFNQGFSDAVMRSEDMCPDDTFAEGFRMKWVGDQLDKDDVGVTNFRMHCQTGTAQSYGQNEGNWYSPAMCPPPTLICGFRVMYEPLTVDDVTCFNEIMVACCFL
ncbi:vitelline membrane outer layer protein 1 homolog [Penaeus vannamei]|uniref:vitelline membrane outer layer protein 1 homolog n=1 Tax=Penaeus vannamei TaxID=6689 RepID=UPI00387F940F